MDCAVVRGQAFAAALGSMIELGSVKEETNPEEVGYEESVLSGGRTWWERWIDMCPRSQPYVLWWAIAIMETSRKGMLMFRDEAQPSSAVHMATPSAS